MTLIRGLIPKMRVPAAALAAVLLLAGCGASTPATSRISAVPSAAAAARFVEPALQRLKAPPGFRAGRCEYLQQSPSVRCFKRNSFVTLNVGVFTALITASGLTPVNATLVCQGHRRPSAAETHETCLGRADAGSTEVSVFLTTNRIPLAALKPAKRAFARTLLGTIYEVTRVESES
jgi:hypothetical protein